MELTQKHIDQIKTAFSKMQSKEDLLHLLNKAKPFLYGKKVTPFELRQITWYANPKLRKKCYTEFKIKKKSGADRTIHSPNKGLKALQKTLGLILQCIFEPHKAAMGFVKNKSILDNARPHVGNRYVYNIDLKDFFQSIDQARFWKCLKLKPFNLTSKKSIKPKCIKIEDYEKSLQPNESLIPIRNKGGFLYNTSLGKIYVGDNLDFEKQVYIRYKDNSSKVAWLVNKFPSEERREIANIIASICCTKLVVERKSINNVWESVERNVLPQGAPTSPVISNIICKRLDYLLSAVAKRFGLKYSRYADDITFSSMHNVYQPESDFLKELHRIITQQGFHINEKKTRLQKDGHRKAVTGLLVNEKLNVQKRFIKQLRMWLYYWERYGEAKAYHFFLLQYSTDKGHLIEGKPNMENVIAGKLDYLKMVKGGENKAYLKLKGRFDVLTMVNKEKANMKFSTPVETIVSPIENVTNQKNVETKPNNFIEKIRISIKGNSTEGKLNRDITYKKGESLPINATIHNIEKIENPDNNIKPRPKETKLFLSLFNNSGGLKYLTHKFKDEKPKYSDFINLCKDEFQKGKIDYPNVPNALLRRIEEFSFSETPEWFIRKGNKKILPRKGWAESSFVEWYSQKINIHPGYDSKWNKEMIIPFKESIEVRAGNLNYIIEDALNESLGDSKNNFIVNQNTINIETAEFYTDVDSFKFALLHIFSTIKDRSDKNFCFEININYINKSLTGGVYKTLIITHIDSEPTKKSNDKDFIKGDLKTIQRKLWGLCNYQIQGKFPDGYKSITILTDNDDEKLNLVTEINPKNIKGFTHILKFY